MDRRRYVPSSEGLEGRELLSTATATSSANPLGSLFGQPSATKTLPVDTASTFRLKALRIEHLPYYLNQLQPGRDLPPAIMTNIQTDLFEVAANLHPTDPAVLDQFNLQIRDALPRQTLTTSNVAGLNHFFALAAR